MPLAFPADSTISMFAGLRISSSHIDPGTYKSR